jgi:hypothetical protein
MLTKLVVGILKKYDIYHTTTISIKLNQKKEHKTLLVFFHTFSIVITHHCYKTHYRNSTQRHYNCRNKR